MKQGWEFKTLGDVLETLRNGVNCKQDKKGIGDKISRIESISNEYFDIEKVGFASLSKSEKEKYRLSKGDILFSHINSSIHVGKTALFDSDEEVYHGVNLLLMKPKPFLSSYYLEHFLKFLFQNGYWRGLCKQSVNQASVNQQDISKVEISFPKSLPEQKRIVAILDEAFDAIAKAKANAEQNLKNAKELFESYLQGVFENKGEGWEEKKLGEVCTLINRGISPKYLETNGVIVLNQKCIRDHKISFEQSRFHDGVSKKVSAEKMVRIGDVLINSTGTGTLGRVAQVREELKDVTVDSHVTIVRPIENLFYLDFFGWALVFIEDEIAKRGEGCGGQTELARSALKDDFSICFPKLLKTQKDIVEKLDALSAESKKLETIYQQKINDLEELKKSILQKAFNGELKTAKAIV